MAVAEVCQNLPKERYALKDDTTITPLHQLGTILDPLSKGARQVLAAALRAEAASFVARFTQSRAA